MWRWILWLVLIIGIATSGFIAMRKRQVPAVSVALPSLEHNIQQINFPAVALCDYYILDQGRIDEYAQFLSDKMGPTKRPFRHFSLEYIRKNLKHFGALINFDLPNLSSDFMDFLRSIDPDRGWNITELITQLTLPCSEQLLRCAWRGQVQSCDKLFAMRPTQMGFCCVFNSRYHLDDVANEPYVSDKISQDNGLSIVVKRNQENQSYLRKTGLGTEVLLFDGEEYPLMEGGAVVSIPASINRSTFIVLSTKEMEASDEVYAISEKRRGCQFSEETYVHCLTACKRDTIETLCGCVPFQMITSNASYQCGLNRLACLNKYREKLLFYYPYGKPDPALQEEYADSLECVCLPDCVRTRLSVQVSFIKFQDVNKDKTFRNFFVRNQEVANTSIIRIYYTMEGQRLYSVEVTERLYELISVLGSQFKTVIGVTVILISEIIYFVTFRWWVHFSTMRKLHSRY